MTMAWRSSAVHRNPSALKAGVLVNVHIAHHSGYDSYVTPADDPASNGLSAWASSSLRRSPRARPCGSKGIRPEVSHAVVRVHVSMRCRCSTLRHTTPRVGAPIAVRSC